MFKYDDYPELKKAFSEFTRLKNKCYALEKKIRPNDEASKIPCTEAGEKWHEFSQNNFALLIYNTFKDTKPKLYNHVKNRFSKWNKVFPKEWEQCDEGLRNDLLGLVLELGYGRYWLPDEYYDDKLIEECLPPPPTHTKQWNFGCEDLSAKSRKGKRKKLSFYEYSDVFNTLKRKFCTVRNGRGFIIVGYCWIFIAFVLGCFLISDKDKIAYGLWAFALLGCAYTVYAYLKKCANYIYLSAKGLYFKEKKYDWANVYVTMNCPGPSLLKNTYENVVYFDDHYLSNEEVSSRAVRRKGLYMELNEERAFYLLSFYNKRVQIINHSQIDKVTTSMVVKHNDRISNLFSQNKQ